MYNENKTEYTVPQNKPEPTKKKSKSGGVLDIIIIIICQFVAFPLFLLFSKIIPDFDWVFNLDRILLFILTYSLVYFVALSLKYITLGALFVSIIFLTYGSIASGDHYGWKNAVFDYGAMIKSIKKGKKGSIPEQKVTITDIDYETRIKNACDYMNPNVRNFALNIINANTEFRNKADDYYQYRTFIQSCAICKYVNEKWNYVYDPKGMEYFAKASESIQHLSGDCDDHAILLASLIKAIGGETRIVLSESHAYPELKIDESDYSNIKYLIENILFTNLIIDGIWGHGKDNEIWLNIDYTGIYPGTKILEGSENIISVVNLLP